MSKGKGPVLWNKWWNKISSISWPRCLFHSVCIPERRKSLVLRSVLRRCGSACCFPAKGRCSQERIRGPEVVGSTAPPITARPSLSTLPHVTVWKTSVCARCQVFRFKPRSHSNMKNNKNFF